MMSYIRNILHLHQSEFLGLILHLKYRKRNFYTIEFIIQSHSSKYEYTIQIF